VRRAAGVSRRLRSEWAGTCCHVIIRGNYRRDLFAARSAAESRSDLKRKPAGKGADREDFELLGADRAGIPSGCAASVSPAERSSGSSRGRCQELTHDGVAFRPCAFCAFCVLWCSFAARTKLADSRWRVAQRRPSPRTAAFPHDRRRQPRIDAKERESGSQPGMAGDKKGRRAAPEPGEGRPVNWRGRKAADPVGFCLPG
jgi:hypothetical protein